MVSWKEVNPPRLDAPDKRQGDGEGILPRWQTVAHRGRRNADEALLAALAAGKTSAEAADMAGVSPRTIARRLTDPAFRQRLAELRGEMVSRASGRMADSMTEAADTLRALLQAEAESTRLGAARSILELGNKLRDAVELEERLAALEKRLTEKNSNGTGTRTPS
jgi:hypothetical protein